MRREMPATMVRLLVLSFVALGTRAESATTQPFYGANRRELQTAVSTTVSTVADLTSTLTNPDIGHIVLAPGTYILSAELSVTRSVIIEAAVAGSVVLDAQASEADGNQRGVLNINPGSSGVVQINGLNITGGYTVEVSAAETCNYPNALFWGEHMYFVSHLCMQGGGVYIESGTVTFYGCQVLGNTAGSVRAHDCSDLP